MDSKKSNSKLATVILTGLAAGAAAWYLLKTDKGRETGEALVNSLEEFSNSFKDKALENISQLSGTAEKLYKDYQAKGRV